MTVQEIHFDILEIDQQTLHAAFLKFFTIPELWNQPEDNTNTSCHINHNCGED